MSEQERKALEYIRDIYKNPLRGFAIPPHLNSEYLTFGSSQGNAYLLSTIYLAGWEAAKKAKAEGRE